MWPWGAILGCAWGARARHMAGRRAQRWREVYEDDKVHFGIQISGMTASRRRPPGMLLACELPAARSAGMPRMRMQPVTTRIAVCWWPRAVSREVIA